MPAGLWLPQGKIDQIVLGKRVAVVSVPLSDPISFITPPISDPDSLFGAYLTLSPQELEEKIIATAGNHPDMLESFDRVKIHFNQAGTKGEGGGSPINYFLAAFKYGEVLPNMVGAPTRLLIKNLGMAESFKPYQVNFLSRRLAEEMCQKDGRDIRQYSYHTLVLSLSQK